MTGMLKSTSCAEFVLEARTLTIRLKPHTLDPGLARSVQLLLDHFAEAEKICLDCSRLHDLDPLATWSLARSLHARRATGTQIAILGLTQPLRRRLRLHPLAAYLEPDDELDDELFTDPDREFPRELRSSRH